MTVSWDRRPFLCLGEPEVTRRTPEKPRIPPRLAPPSRQRQSERLGPQFKQLVDAFANARLRSETAQDVEIDPELVIVFDLAGTVQDLKRAVAQVEGFEFLTELADDDAVPDDDFHLTARGKRIDSLVGRSVNVVASNAAAVSQLVRLFDC